MSTDLRLNNKPYTVYAAERRSGRRWLRVLVMSVVLLFGLVLAAAGGTYLWLNWKMAPTHQDPNASTIDSILHATTSSAGGTATTLEPPNTQNILVLGSDNRENEGEKYGRSDTLMVVHIDREQDFVSILSIPRDLRVEIPGHGVQKINAAYAIGGTALSIEAVQQATGIDLDHYVNIDFDAFRQLTTELGGIYVDVDRRYYYKGLDYEIIDLQPGYQALMGENALDYVRFRHDGNNGFSRILRQQRFLRAAKEQISKLDAVVKIPSIVDLVAQNVKTDLTTAQVLRLALWGARLGGGRIEQVDLEATTADIGGASYVLVSDAAMKRAVQDLFTPPEATTRATTTTSTGEQGAGSAGTSSTEAGSGGTAGTTATSLEKVDLTGITVDIRNGNGRSGEAAAAASWLRSMGAKVGTVGDASSFDVANTRIVYPSDHKGAAKLVGRAVGITRLNADSSVVNVSLVLGKDFVPPTSFKGVLTIDDLPDKGEYKALRTLSGLPMVAPSYLPDGYKRKDSRMYEIDTGDGPKKAVKVIYRYGNEDQYLGLMATAFTDAPAAAAGETLTVGGTVYTVVSFGGKVDHIWWKRDGVLFWVSNTLSSLVDREEMLKVATGMVPVP